MSTFNSFVSFFSFKYEKNSSTKISNIYITRYGYLNCEIIFKKQNLVHSHIYIEIFGMSSQLYSGRRNLWANKEKYCEQHFSYNSGLAMGCFILDEWTLEGP